MKGALNVILLVILTVILTVAADDVTHLLNCGGGAVTVDNRLFQPDESHLATSATPSTVIADPENPSSVPVIHRTARLFNSPSSYEFPVIQSVIHVIRFHFRYFPTSSVRPAVKFHVIAAGFVLLTNFSLPNSDSVIREFVIKPKSDRLTIFFIPNRDSVAWINAIEVFSANFGLISDLAWWENGNSFKNYGLTDLGIENLFRINVGGGKVTPFNDTLWRIWVNDEKFLESGVSDSKIRGFGGRIGYREGGASNLIAPDHVYDSCRVGSCNLSWVFPVDHGFDYLIRLHFCDIVSLALNQLYFDILINGEVVYKGFDLSEASDQTLASPYYIDFVARVSERRNLSVGIRPDDHGLRSNHVGLLNGLEIFKLSNAVGSLDGTVPAKELYWGHGEGVFYVFFRSLMCGSVIMILVLGVFMLGKWLRKEMRSSLTWLPVASDERDLGSGKTVW